MIERVRKIRQRSDDIIVESWVIMQVNAGMRKAHVGMKNMSLLP